MWKSGHRASTQQLPVFSPRARGTRDFDRGDIHLAHLTTDFSQLGTNRDSGFELRNSPGARVQPASTAASLDVLNGRLSDVQARFSSSPTRTATTLRNGSSRAAHRLTLYEYVWSSRV